MTEPFPVFGLQGRVAVVTGGALGIGAGIATALAAAGAQVLIADVDLDAAERTASALRDGGHDVTARHVDLADEASIDGFCQALREAGCRPWILVNNAGLQDRESFLDSTTAEWARVHAVNARAPFILIRELARMMIDAGDGGRIVNIASAALIGSLVHGLVAYTASKGAVTGLSTAAAFELAEHGITVNTILPGGVPTPGSINAKGPPPDGPARRRPPLGMCEPVDIAAAVCYFASPAARRVTNQILAVDGGFSLS